MAGEQAFVKDFKNFLSGIPNVDFYFDKRIIP